LTLAPRYGAGTSKPGTLARRGRTLASYLIRRFLLMVLTLFGVSLIIFVLLRVVPGNIADILVASAGFIDPQDKARIEAELGLDQPLVVGYVRWITGLVQGDLGFSYVSERRAIDEIIERVPITAKLALLALLFSVSLGVPLGVISAVRQNTALDYLLRIISLSGLSLPSFWLGLLILMASVHWFGTIPIYDPEPASLWDELSALALPAAAVGFRSSALVTRLTRSSMLEVMRQDYIRTARSKGASESAVTCHHALRNAALPLVTIIGIEAAFLVGGLIVTETVFNIPGIARYLVESMNWRDYPIVQNLVMFIAVVVVVINFVVDLLYAALDPRVKYEG
jgi:peptide/nickel transport system permease protein